jgi:hypothetical protein
VTVVVEMRDEVLFGIHEGRRPFGKCRRIYKDIVKIDVNL